MEIVTYSHKSELTPRWDDYVHVSKTSTFYHLSGWRQAIEQTFGHQSFYITLESDGEIQGILPLFLIKNPFYGRVLVSIPYGVYGGIVAGDIEAQQRLLDEAVRLAQEQQVKYLELRSLASDNLELPEKDLYCTFIQELPTDSDDCLGIFPRKARAAVRKGIAHGLVAETGLDQLETCYALYTRNKRDLGSPFLPFDFFKNLVRAFPQNTTVLCVKCEGKPVAAVLVFFFKDTVLPYYSGSLPECLRCHVNNFMYYKLMQYSVEQGYRYFDFGRSRKDSGSYNFKRHQGFEPQQLHYQYYLHTAKQIPNISPSNPKTRFLTKAWKRLPVGLATALSGPIVKRMPY